MQKKKKKTIIYLISGITIFVLVAVGGYYLIGADKQTSTNSGQSSNSPSTPSPAPNIPDNPPPNEKENDECPLYDKQNNLVVPAGAELFFLRGESLRFANLSQVPRDFVVKLWKKGYHWCDILQFWNWKIPEIDIPNLNAEQRIGMINILSVFVDSPKRNPEKHLGGIHNFVVIVRKISGGEPQINIDSGFVKKSKSNIEKIINLVFELEKNISLSDYQISVLNVIGAQNLGQEGEVSYGMLQGKSAGSAFYLALLSALYQKPISRSVAATGSISGRAKKAKTTAGTETNFPGGTNLPIRGLKAKITAAVEKGINRFVLSKYQSSPNLLSLIVKDEYCDADGNPHVEAKWVLKDDYQKEVPSEIKAKINVCWTENIQDLRDLVLQEKLS